MVLSFQARLAVILQTLAKVAGDLLHLLFIFVVLLLVWGVQAHLLVGWRCVDGYHLVCGNFTRACKLHDACELAIRRG